MMILHGCLRCGGALVAGHDAGDLVCISCARPRYALAPLPYVAHGEDQVPKRYVRRG